MNSTRKQQRCRQILEAAGRCFLRKGLTGASVSDICAEVGIGPGHLYHYFDSKDSLIAAFVEMNLKEADDELTARFTDRAPAGDFPPDFAWLGRTEELALIFEILAQAARSQRIAKILQAHGKRLLLNLSDAVVAACRSD